MSQQVLSAIILERLLNNYGPMLSVDNVAEELGLKRDAFYARRSRGRTGGMPAPVDGVIPLQFRAADLARWFAGEVVTDTPPDPDPERVRRRPGRPRNVMGQGSRRARARG